MSARLPSALLSSVCGVAAAVIGLSPAEARATEPCRDPNVPCHNNFAEAPAMWAFAADGYGLGLVATIGNAAALSRGTRPGVGWLTIGYIATVENLVLGLTWTSLGGSSLARFPYDGYAGMQVGLGAAHLAVGAITLGVTAAAHARRTGYGYADSTVSLAPPVLPGFAPVPGGGALVLSGRF